MTARRFRPYPQKGAITIPAGATQVFRTGGNFVNIKQANTGFTIRLDDDHELAAAQNRRFKLEPGAEFEKVEVINDSGGSLTFQLEIGFGSVESDDVTINGTVRTSGGASGSYGATAVGLAAVQIFSANTGRTGWTIQNKGSASIYIGDNNAVTTATGLEIAPGGIYGEDSQGDIYAISGTAGQDVRHREVTT